MLHCIVRTTAHEAARSCFTPSTLEVYEIAAMSIMFPDEEQAASQTKGSILPKRATLRSCFLWWVSQCEASSLLFLHPPRFVACKKLQLQGTS